MKKIEKFHDTDSLFESLTQHLKEKMEENHSELFCLALSGGNTAIDMFDFWVNKNQIFIPWDKIQFFWVDERCVSPKDTESNYFQACQHLFEPLHISTEYIHRIRGEEDPYDEAQKYSDLVNKLVPQKDNRPSFDAIILGAGTDGHTASIFPDDLSLLTNKDNYTVSQHPDKPQMRISMTGTLILNAKTILLPVIGKEKQNVIKKILSDNKENLYLPANYIYRAAPDITLYTNI